MLAWRGIKNTNLDSNRIALFSEEFPPFAFGGISTVAFDLACSLSKKKVPTTVFCGKSPKLAVEEFNDYLQIIRLPCRDLPPRFVWFQIQNFRNVLKQLSGSSYIIHAVNPQVSILCIYLKKKLKQPLVTSYHGVPVYDSKGFLNSPTQSWTKGDFGFNVLEFPLNEYHTRMSLANSDQIISCSNVTLAELKSAHSGIENLKNSIVIPNGINFDEFQKIKNANRKKTNSGELTLIFVGRLYNTKGIMYLIKAFEYLIHDYPNIKLKIFGNGPLKEVIQSIVSLHDLKDKVILAGQIKRTDVLKELAKADIFILPSVREAQSMVILEAMGLETPVVAFDYPFAQECIHHMQNGLLARPKDPVDLAAKIGVLLSDSKLREQIGRNACDYVRQYHNWDTLVNRYIDLYKSLES